MAGAVVTLLIALAGRYGFHRDEFYFIVSGRHPAFGYVDQPPLTPLLSAAMVTLFGLSPTAIRILPAIVVGVIVVLTALITKELGGSRRAQLVAAATVGLSGYLAAGHLDHTTTYDLLGWALVLWLVARLLAGADERLWLAVGVTAGLALENKDTIVILGFALTVGLLVTRRWVLLASKWPWLGFVVALLVWAPNLAWQAQHNFPQITMARALARSADANRAHLVPELVLLAGPVLFPVSLVGAISLLTSSRLARWRPFGWGFPAILGLVLFTGGKSYYAAGFYPTLMAAGATLVDRWLAEPYAQIRQAALVAAAAASGGAVALLALPIVPPEALASTPINAIYKEAGEQIGWPNLVATVTTVVGGLSPSERANAIVLTANYGEAGALELLGAGLPRVYSGHNAYWDWGPPDPTITTVVLVGRWDPAPFFDGCRTAAKIDNGVAIQNEEQGAPVLVCTSVRAPWSALWPSLRHVD